MTAPILAFHIIQLLDLLLWAAVAGIAFLAWKKGKALAWLLVLVGAGVKALLSFLSMVGAIGWESAEAMMWLGFFAEAILGYGIYLLAMPLVKERLAQIKSQIAPPQPPAS